MELRKTLPGPWTHKEQTEIHEGWVDALTNHARKKRPETVHEINNQEFHYYLAGYAPGRILYLSKKVLNTAACKCKTKAGL